MLFIGIAKLFGGQTIQFLKHFGKIVGIVVTNTIADLTDRGFRMKQQLLGLLDPHQIDVLIKTHFRFFLKELAQINDTDMQFFCR